MYNHDANHLSLVVKLLTGVDGFTSFGLVVQMKVPTTGPFVQIKVSSFGTIVQMKVPSIGLFIQTKVPSIPFVQFGQFRTK